MNSRQITWIRRLAWGGAGLGLGVVGWLGWHFSRPAAQTPASAVPGRTGATATVQLPSPARRNVVMDQPAVAPLVATNPVLPSTTNRAVVAPIEPAFVPHPVHSVFEAQIELARRAISGGSLDGVLGPQTRAALRAFQRQEHLSPTGELDEDTQRCLVISTPPLTIYNVTAEDVERPQPLAATWLGKSLQSRLDFASLLELVSEKSQSRPDWIRSLNPGTDWARLRPGMAVVVPRVSCVPGPSKAAFVRIDLAAKTLEAFDARTNLVAHFPCSIAARLEKRPVGILTVTRLVANPSYVMDPRNFPESAEAQALDRKLILPPGPNNPVGTAWISLDKPGYGIHGTPRPEAVGRAESHGCFRLANWNAEYLMQLVDIGTPVIIRP